LEPKAKLLGGLDDLAWRLGAPFIQHAIRRKYELFKALIRPTPGMTILDVGATAQVSGGFNFLERWYPWPSRITAVVHGGRSALSGFHGRFPRVKPILGDGRALPFADGAFDLVFSNGVIEHVGSTEDQRRFVGEALRVGRRVFLSTPNSRFPLDTHTMFPLVHYLPWAQRAWIYRRTGREVFSAPGSLDLLDEHRLRSLFPDDVRLRLVRRRFGGMVSTFIALAIPGSRAEAA
jgi:hypothetical protein